MADNKQAGYEFEQFAAIRRYQLVLTFSPDGSEVAYSTNINGQFNLWRQPSEGGYPHQLTFYTEQAVRQAGWSPDGKSILYTADRHGDEFHQLYLLPAHGGLPRQITGAPQVQHYIADPHPWSPDGRYIAFCANDREPTDQDVLVRDMQTGDLRRVLAGGGYYQPVDWSPDGKCLTAVRLDSNTNLSAYLIPLDGGEARNLTPHEGEVLYIPGPWATDGSGFYMLCNEGREFTGLAFYSLADDKWQWVETPNWDVETVEVSGDGHFVAWSVDEDGYSRLYVREVKGGRTFQPEGLPEGVISFMRLSHRGDKLAVLLARPDSASEVFVLDLASGKAAQLTYSMLGGIEPSELVRPELIHYPTHDGKEIPAFLYRPKNGDGRVPVVLSIHGGPEAQERPSYLYSGLYQYWLSRGLGVLAPNVRGSTGYGKTYQMLIHHDWGGNELKDFEAAVQYLRSLDWVDPDRIGVFGGSFGGFATLSCVTRLPDYWAAAVDIVGPSNLLTFAKAVPPTWKRFMAQWVGDTETEVDFLMERSPITYVENVRTPLLVIQGAKDPRVVKGESDQMVEVLRARGVEVRYDVYEDEGHGFTKRENELKAMGDAAHFMEQYLAEG